MEKSITIDGKEVRFKSTAATPLRYKAQFGRDFFVDIIKLKNLDKFKGENGTLNMEALAYVDFEFFYNLIWTLAKTANPQIAEPITWLDDFETFPLAEIMPELNELLANSLNSKKK